MKHYTFPTIVIIVTEQELFKQKENYIDDSLSNYLKKMYQIEFNKQLSKKKIFSCLITYFVIWVQ